MRISPSVPVLIARGFQAILSATVFIITILLITGNKFGPLPHILEFSAGVSLATLIAALSTSIFRTSLHPWIRNTIDGGILSLNMAVGTMMASELQGYSCSSIPPYFSEVVCGGYHPEILNLEGCYFSYMLTVGSLDTWSRCVLYSCNTAVMLSNVPVILAIWTLIYLRTERGWRVGGWTIERVHNPYEPIAIDSVIHMVSIPVRARLS